MTWPWVAALAASAGYAVASLLQARGARGGGGAAGELVRSPAYLAGTALDLASWASSLVAVRGLPVVVVQPVLAGSLALTAVLARLAGDVRLPARQAAAIGLLVGALAVVAAGGAPGPAPRPPEWVRAVLVVAAAAAAGALLLARRAGWAVQAALAGAAYSVTALCARALQLPDPLWRVAAHPVAWALAASAAVGAAAYARALARGPLGPATALLWAVEVVLPAVAGALLLGEHARPGWGVPVAAGVAVVAVASVDLARSPALDLTSTPAARA